MSRHYKLPRLFASLLVACEYVLFVAAVSLHPLSYNFGEVQLELDDLVVSRIASIGL